MPTARSLGDRDDRCGLDRSNHRSRHEADLSTWSQAKFDRCLPGAGLDDPAGDATHARLGGRFDGDFDRSWGRALFHRRRLSPLADAAIPQRNMAQLRADRSQLSLRSYSARRSLATNLSAGWQKLNLSPVRGAMPRCERAAMPECGDYAGFPMRPAAICSYCAGSSAPKAGTEAAGFGMCRKNAETNAEIRPNKASAYNPPA